VTGAKESKGREKTRKKHGKRMHETEEEESCEEKKHEGNNHIGASCSLFRLIDVNICTVQKTLIH
jgi:hypothetical protein